MKARIEIEDGKSKIILTPENAFEKTMLKDANSSRLKLDANIKAEYASYADSNCKLVINIVEK